MPWIATSEKDTDAATLEKSSSVQPTPWSDFAVGTPNTKANWIAPDCVPFHTVSHVTHVKNALSIARTGRLKPDLVFDKTTRARWANVGTGLFLSPPSSTEPSKENYDKD